MAAGPVGSTWASGAWSATAWDADTWADASPPTPPPAVTVPARQRYVRRAVPEKHNPGWFSTELQRIQAAIPAWQARTVRTAYAAALRTLKATDRFLAVDATTGACSIILPDALRVDGLVVTVKKTDASTNHVTLVGTIDATVNLVLAAQYDAVTIAASGGLWHLLGTV